MRKLSFALIASIGLAGLALSVPAQAGVYVGVGVPGVAVVAPPYVRGYYGGPRFYGPGYARVGLGWGRGGWGFRGGWGYHGGWGYRGGRRW
jgi:hypothetical protein